MGSTARWRRRHAGHGKEEQEDSRALPSLREARLSLPAQEVRKLRLPQTQNALLQLGLEGQASNSTGHGPDEVHEAHATTLQKRLPRGHHAAASQEGPGLAADELRGGNEGHSSWRLTAFIGSRTDSHGDSISGGS